MENQAKAVKVEEIKKHYDALLDKPELQGLKLLFGINMFLLIALIVMPQYFGIHLGYDITCSRFSNILLIIYALLQYRVLNLFIKNFLKCSITIPLMIYLFVTIYTMIYRININAFMLVFFELLTMYMLIFAIRYVIGIRKTIKIIIGIMLPQIRNVLFGFTLKKSTIQISKTSKTAKNAKIGVAPQRVFKKVPFINEPISPALLTKIKSLKVSGS